MAQYFHTERFIETTLQFCAQWPSPSAGAALNGQTMLYPFPPFTVLWGPK